MADGDRQYKKFKGFKWTVGNEDVPALALVVDDTSKQLHICEPADVITDWNIAACTHPTVFIHSATTPATDYIKMYHDATIAYIDSVGATTLRLLIAGTAEIDLTASALSPAVTDSNALGTTSLMWGDLFLASGGVINFNAGDVTLTHGANVLTLAGGDLFLRGGNAVVTKHTTTNVTTAGAGTYTAAALYGGRITRDPTGAARTDTTGTAAAIVGAISGATVGDMFACLVENTADAAEAITLAGGAGVTLERLDGTGATVAQNGSAILFFVLTNVTASSEAVSCYVIAS